MASWKQTQDVHKKVDGIAGEVAFRPPPIEIFDDQPLEGGESAQCYQACARLDRSSVQLGCTISRLSTPFHKYNPVCEGFLAQTRRERRAYPSGVCKE